MIQTPDSAGQELNHSIPPLPLAIREVISRINVALTIFQSYCEFEAGDNQSVKFNGFKQSTVRESKL